MLYGAAYYPEHRDENRWEHDLDKMQRAGVNCLRIGEFCWVLFEPSDGVYDFGWLERFNELAEKRGIRILLCPPLRTVPAWLVEQDRSILIEDKEGDRLEFGSRYCFCINHPLILEKGRQLARVMCEKFAGDTNIAGWHLDNEHGDEPDCHCPICTQKFKDWCKAKYGTTQKLNDAWGLVFWGLCLNSFDQVMTPRKSKTFHSPGHDLDWRRFRSESTINAVRMQAEVVREYIRAPQFITSNNQTFWNNRTDYYEMAKELDVTGANYYPSYGEAMRESAMGLANCRCYKPGATEFQIHELRCGAHMIPGLPGITPLPGEVEKLAMHSIANGARGLFYFRWRACPFGCEQHHGTVTGFDGQELAIYPEVQKVGLWIKDNLEHLEEAKLTSEIALMFDFPTRWVMETGVFWNGPGDMYMQQCKTLYAAISELGYNCDTINAEGDFSQYKVLVVPAVSAMSEEAAQRLCKFVEDGGTLVWHPFSAMKDSNTRIYPGRMQPEILEMFDVEINDCIPLTDDSPASFEYGGKSYEGRLFCDFAKGVASEDVKAEYDSNYYKGSPALIRKAHGKGSAWYLTTFAGKDFYRDWFASMLEECDIAQPEISGIAPELELCTQYAKDYKLLYIVNHSSREVVQEYGGRWNDIYNIESGSEAMSFAPNQCRVIKVDS